MRRTRLIRRALESCLVLTGLMVATLFAPPVKAAEANGAVAVPTSAAYADLTLASNKMLGDLKAVLPRATSVIFYDASLFSAVPYYASALDLVRAAAKNFCAAEESGKAGPIGTRAIVPTVDAGTAASGLASLIQVTVPSYAVQGQTLTIDNSALIGSFATAAKAAGLTVVNPVYLLPAVSQHTLECNKLDAAQSFSDLWKFASGEENRALYLPDADKKPLKDAIDGFHKLRDLFLASDKGPPLLSRVLTVETLGQTVDAPGRAAVIDIRLDSVDVDSTTRSVLWWRKTTFSVNVAAHYWLFSTHGKGEQFGITLEQPGYVNILKKDVDEKEFAAEGSVRAGRH